MSKKKLYLIRHAKSDWDRNSQSDFLRPLNERGKRDAPKMANLIRQKGTLPDLMITSSATRAKSTARLMAHELNYNLEDILETKKAYLPIVSDLVSILNTVDNGKDCVYLFSHNPGISELVNYLSGEALFMKTCCATELVLEVDNWEELSMGTCTFNTFFSPKEI